MQLEGKIFGYDMEIVDEMIDFQNSIFMFYNIIGTNFKLRDYVESLYDDIILKNAKFKKYDKNVLKILKCIILNFINPPVSEHGFEITQVE